MRSWTALECGSLSGFLHGDPVERPYAKLSRPGMEFSGPVTYVGDGDSVCVAVGSDQSSWVEVRLATSVRLSLRRQVA